MQKIVLISLIGFWESNSFDSLEIVLKWVIVVKFNVNAGGGDDSGCFQITVRKNTTGSRMWE